MYVIQIFYNYKTTNQLIVSSHEMPLDHHRGIGTIYGLESLKQYPIYLGINFI